MLQKQMELYQPKNNREDNSVGHQFICHHNNALCISLLATEHIFVPKI